VTDSRPARDDVIDAARARAAALAARDEAALRRLMHPGLQWTTYRGNVLGYEEYIEGNTSGPLRWRAQRLSDVQVVVVGDTAVLTAWVTDEVRRDGHDQVFTLRLTQTWVRTFDGWRCLAGHASSPAGQAAPLPCGAVDRACGRLVWWPGGFCNLS
jgi:ketosteroid isomerase-like protein